MLCAFGVCVRVHVRVRTPPPVRKPALTPHTPAPQPKLKGKAAPPPEPDVAEEVDDRALRKMIAKKK